jgi:hypothetical protein
MMATATTFTQWVTRTIQWCRFFAINPPRRKN